MTSRYPHGADLPDTWKPVPAHVLHPDSSVTARSMPQRRGRARWKSICCIMALEIAEYDTKPVFAQIRLTRDFEELLSFATAKTTPDDLVSIVREDGALLSFVADCKACFKAALAIRTATSMQDRYHDLRLRIGIDLGEIEIAEDEFGFVHASGEGKQDAERVMRQCPPRQICVTRSFLELLSRMDPELAGLLQCQGASCDAIAPPLSVYRLSPQSTGASESLTNPAPATVTSWPANGSSVQAHPPPRHSTLAVRNRVGRVWLVCALSMLVAAGAGAALFHWLRGEAPTVKPLQRPAPATSAHPGPSASASMESPAQPKSAPLLAPSSDVSAGPAKARIPAPLSRPQPPIGASPVATRAAKAPSTVSPPLAKPEDKLKTERRVENSASATVAPAPAARASGTLVLAIKPWGEVYVDGKKVGVTPPLQSLEVPPGRRQITIENASLPIYRKTVTVKPHSKITLTHDFGCVSRWDNPCRGMFGRDSSYAPMRSGTGETGHGERMARVRAPAVIHGKQ